MQAAANSAISDPVAAVTLAATITTSAIIGIVRAVSKNDVSYLNKEEVKVVSKILGIDNNLSLVIDDNLENELSGNQTYCGDGL